MAKKILVAYDGSELSQQAVREAKTNATEHPDTVIHVITVIYATGPVTNTVFMRSIGHELAEQYESEIAKVKDELEAEDYSVETKVIVGESNRNPGAAICDYAKEMDAELIIIGNRGLGGMKKLLLGSVSDYVVHHSACPVLIMK